MIYLFMNYQQSMVRRSNLSTDGGPWHPQACKFLKLKHHLHSTFEKGIIEETVQYVKDST
jgi:putative transposase